MSEQEQKSITDENTQLINDELKQNIKEEQGKEVSYILEASQADDKRSKYLAKKNEYTVVFEDGSTKTYKRRPLSNRKNKEIDDLRSAFTANRYETKNKIIVNNEEYNNINDVLYEAFKRTAKYCLGMTDEEYDVGIWEDDPEYMDRDIYGLRSILGACMLRAVHGIAYFRQPSKTT